MKTAQRRTALHSRDEPPSVVDEEADDLMTAVIDRLSRIESALEFLVGQRTVKDVYSVEEFAEIVGLATWTVRQYCRLGRLNAIKKMTTRGRTQEWGISHAELLRYQSEGLLPLPSAWR